MVKCNFSKIKLSVFVASLNCLTSSLSQFISSLQLELLTHLTDLLFEHHFVPQRIHLLFQFYFGIFYSLNSLISSLFLSLNHKNFFKDENREINLPPWKGFVEEVQESVGLVIVNLGGSNTRVALKTNIHLSKFYLFSCQRITY